MDSFETIRNQMKNCYSASEAETLICLFTEIEGLKGDTNCLGTALFLRTSSFLVQQKSDFTSLVVFSLCELITHSSVTKQELVSRYGTNTADLAFAFFRLRSYPIDVFRKNKAQLVASFIHSVAQDPCVVVLLLSYWFCQVNHSDFNRDKTGRQFCTMVLKVLSSLNLMRDSDDLRIKLKTAAFRIVYPFRSEVLERRIALTCADRTLTLQKIVAELEMAFSQREMKVEITGNEKSSYDIYNAYKNRNSLPALFELQFTTSDVENAYRTLGVLHSVYQPEAQFLTDNMLTPTVDGELSLESRVRTTSGYAVTIKIFTKNAHEIASRVRINSVKNQLFTDKNIYLVTPNNALKKLPQGATPIDFAFLLHSDLGMICSNAIVDGKAYPLTEPLRSGQKISISGGEDVSITPCWLDFVVTNKARRFILRYLRRRCKEELVSLGKHALAQRMSEYGLQIAAALELSWVRQKFQCEDEVDLFCKVARADISVNAVLFTLFSPLADDYFKSPKLDSRRASSILGIGNSEVQFAPCCNPIPYEDVLLDFSPSKGIRLHSMRCHSTRQNRQYQQRTRIVSWRQGISHRFFCKLSLSLSRYNEQINDAVRVIENQDLIIVNLRCECWDSAILVQLGILAKDKSDFDRAALELQSMSMVRV